MKIFLILHVKLPTMLTLTNYVEKNDTWSAPERTPQEDPPNIFWVSSEILRVHLMYTILYSIPHYSIVHTSLTNRLIAASNEYNFNYSNCYQFLESLSTNF